MKISAELFDKAIKNQNFEVVVNHEEDQVWKALKCIVSNFLGNHRCVDYECIVEELLTYFQKIGAQVSLKCFFAAYIWITCRQTVAIRVKQNVKGSSKI